MADFIRRYPGVWIFLPSLAGVNDLGGVVIDLGGGDYKISKPITFSPGAGNIVVSISFIIFLICHTFSFCSSEFVYLPMEI
jgi:hypothetical protein